MLSISFLQSWLYFLSADQLTRCHGRHVSAVPQRRSGRSAASSSCSMSLQTIVWLQISFNHANDEQRNSSREKENRKEMEANRSLQGHINHTLPVWQIDRSPANLPQRTDWQAQCVCVCVCVCECVCELTDETADSEEKREKAKKRRRLRTDCIYVHLFDTWGPP